MILSPIKIILEIILHKYVNEFYCLIVISEVPFDFIIPVSFTYINSNNTNNLTDNLLDLSEKGCSDYVVQMSEPTTFMESFAEVNRKGIVRRSDKKIIFVPSPLDENNNIRSKLLDVLTIKETRYVANILLIIPATGQTEACLAYDLVTHKFVGTNEEIAQPDYLDKWNSCTEMFERNANLFPHDMTNLQGKLVKIAGFTYKPYVLLDLDTNIFPSDRDGTEIRLIEEFCRWINCTIEMVRDDENEWGDIYDNLTGCGVLGILIEERADIGISALYSWYEEFVYFDFSAATFRTAVTCIAPAPRLLASWGVPLLPFGWFIWLAIVFTFIYASIALTIAKRCSTDMTLLTVFGILVSQAQNNSVESSISKWRVRRITGWLLITGLILDNAYSAGLASTFTVPKYEQAIDTIKDITDKKMEWGATHYAWVSVLKQSQEPMIIQLASQFRVYDKETLKEKSFSRSMAFAIERLSGGGYAIEEYITDEAAVDLMLMLDDFYYGQCVAMLRKSSPYTAKLSDLIGRLHESGLLLAWETQIALQHFDFNVQIAIEFSRDKKDVDVTPLGHRHVLGFFFIYFGGVLCSVVAFILELFVHKRS